MILKNVYNYKPLERVDHPNRKCVTINGVVYQSIRDAARNLGISEYKAKMADDNKQ